MSRKHQHWTLPATLSVAVSTVVDAGPSVGFLACGTPCPDGGHQCPCCQQNFINAGLCDGGSCDACYDTRFPSGRCDPGDLMFCSC